MPEKLFIVALDPQVPRARDLLQHAIMLATSLQARLMILHVIKDETPLPTQGQTLEQVRAELAQNASIALEALLASLPRQAPHAEIQVCFGAPDQAIAALAGVNSADLIIMGLNDKHSLRARIIGSTTERVIQNAARPVLVVKKASSRRYRNIVAAIDFSAQSGHAASKAATLFPDTNLHLVHVAFVPVQFEQALLKAGTTTLQLAAFRQARLAEGRIQLSDLSGKITNDPSRIKTEIILGEPAASLLELSRKRQVQLIVVGAKHQAHLIQVMLGSVARTLLRDAACDVLIC